MPKITELYAWVLADKDENDEGVPAQTVTMFDGRRCMMPLMGADAVRAEGLRPMAQGMANLAGKPLKLIRSIGLEVVGEVKPDGR